MTETQTSSEQITEEVTAWEGVTAAHGARGEWSFRLGRKELGHLHGDRVLHLAFPKAVWHDLYKTPAASTTTPSSPASPATEPARSKAPKTSAT